MQYLQRLVIDCDDRSVKIGILGKEDVFSGTHEELFPLFLAHYQRLTLKKSRKRINFQSLYADGVIQDEKGFSAYLHFLITSAHFRWPLFGKVEVLVVVPSDMSAVSRSLWIECLDLIGITSVTFCSQVLAGAVGSGFSFPLSTFAPVLNIGWSTSEFSGLLFDQSTFSQSLGISALELIAILQEQSFKHQVADCSHFFWHTVVENLGLFLLADPKKMESTYQHMVKAEKTVIPLSFLVEIIQSAFYRALLMIQMRMIELSASELSLATTQGILLMGELGEKSHLAPYFSKQLAIPVYTVSDRQNVVMAGGKQIFTKVLTSEE